MCGEKEISTATRLSTIYLGLARDVKPGDQILIDDGKIELKVLATDRDHEVDVEVVYGGLGEAPQGHQPARLGGFGPEHDGERY